MKKAIEKIKSAGSDILQTDLKRIESKLDLIIDAFGLSENHRLAPAEVSEMAKNIVLKFHKKEADAQKRKRKPDNYGIHKD